MSKVTINNADKNKRFSKVLKAGLVWKGINQKQLAKYMNVGEHTIAIYLNEPQRMSVDVFRDITQYLQTEADEIVRFLK